MKTLILFIAFISICTEIFGEKNTYDWAYLKERENVNCQLDDISVLTNDPMSLMTNESANNSEFKIYFEGIAEIGYAIKVTSYGYDLLKLNALYGCKVNPNFYFGLGTGLRLYLDNHAIFNTFAAYPEIPFFADIRMNFNNKKVTPYLALDIGYTFQADDNFKGLGFLINPAAGLSFKTSAKTSMNVGLGYEMQQVKDYELDGPSKSVSFGAISINAGITF